VLRGLITAERNSANWRKIRQYLARNNITLITKTTTILLIHMNGDTTMMMMMMMHERERR